jgi:hypothetical protein
MKDIRGSWKVEPASIKWIGILSAAFYSRVERSLERHAVRNSAPEAPTAVNLWLGIDGLIVIGGTVPHRR